MRFGEKKTIFLFIRPFEILEKCLGVLNGLSLRSI